MHSRELGRGTFGIVYLYQMRDNPANKIALKAARVGNRMSISSINNEGNYHKKIASFSSSSDGLNKYVPKFLGQTYFDKTPVIKSEYILYSIEEYLHLNLNQTNIKTNLML